MKERAGAAVVKAIDGVILLLYGYTFYRLVLWAIALWGVS